MSTSKTASLQRRFGGWLLLCVLAAGLGGTWFWRQARTEVLAAQLTLARDDLRVGSRVQAENQRLAAAQPTPAELDRWRDEAAASRRLRGEIEARHAHVLQMERDVAAAEAAVPTKK